MNLRHTAALALVGWYLMIPPSIEPDLSSDAKVQANLNNPPAFEFDDKAPLSRWEIDKSFDRDDDCQQAIKKERFR
jgi:hypothetical protein